ncbi:MAG: DNA repair protein RecO C-terminal domain-containing protein [Bacteroides sp.]|nr:DNA repair protein RecO C-terminal domain-containing protein [Bacteroides sp.]MCM1378478.1 DNA repair protein RecO C-terminal domain-containing protein [Bacteroides sp.]MCM1444779.1 DNA repair protein RecO C-terminal domain-containing protein [Prevotella sp.]
MERKLCLLPLRLTQHSDRTSILQSYSREMGAVTFAVPSGSGGGATRRRALLQPLTPLEVVASICPGREVHTFREPRVVMPVHLIQADPERRAVVMFLAEALQIIMRQAEADAATYDFIIEAIERLNDPVVLPANFHLTFLIGLSVMLGIAPDAGSYRPGMVFDMIDGVFRPSAALHGHCLSPQDSASAATLLHLNWANMSRLHMSGRVRGEALDRILEYYTLHYANLSAMKSPAVLHALFS